MIYRFKKVTDQLYRGSAPSKQDVIWLKNNLHINKIVSLDKFAGDLIDPECKNLNIKHVMLPIEVYDFKKSLLNFLHHDLKKLFLKDGPTFVHCAAGKDRTGLAVALIQSKYLGIKPEEALKQAKSLGFGIDVNPEMIKVFEKLIMSCKSDNDVNNADIVSNERDYIGDNRDSFLDEGHQGSFAPYLSVTMQSPMDSVYNFINDQSPTRENYDPNKVIKEHKFEDDTVPLVGQYNNNAGIHGAGPAEPVGGFISE